MALLETQGLSKAFGGLRAIWNLDIEIEEGTIHGVPLWVLRGQAEIVAGADTLDRTLESCGL